MKCIRRTAKYTWQDYKTSEEILSELKISPVVKKILNYRNKWTQHVRRMDRDRQTDRQTATLNYEISTVWETKPRTTPRNISRPVHETGTGHEA
jgi:hypothetical protein